MTGKEPMKKERFSLDLKTDSESLPVTDAGSEFQTLNDSRENTNKYKKKKYRNCNNI